MFDRSKRKSFLFFGGLNQDQKQTSQDEKLNSSKNRTRSVNTSPKPLYKRPLNSESGNYNGITVQRAAPAARSSESAASPVQEIAQQSRLARQGTVGRRRPPPPVNLPSLQTVMIHNDERAELSKRQDSDDTLKAVQTLVESDPHGKGLKARSETTDEPAQADTTHLGHQRQRSEVDDLVDDLNDFINESNLKVNTNGSTDSLNKNLKHDDLSITNDTYYSDPESTENVSPLYGKHEMMASNHNSPGSLSQGGSLIDSQSSITESLTAQDDGMSLESFPRSISAGIPASSRFIVTNGDVTSDSEHESDYADLREHEANYGNDSDNERTQEINSEDDQLYEMMTHHENERRKYRVVNEEKPNFFLNDSTTDDEVTSAMDTDINSMTPSFAKRLSISSSNRQQEAFTNPEIYDVADSPASKETRSISNDTINTPASSQHPIETKPSSNKPMIPDKNVRLVSSYVEELRLVYFPTSNSLQLPPNLPYSLKNKNTLEQPQNIKVTIRTSTRQVGIKHGKAKQKLLSLETTKEEEESESSSTVGLQLSSESGKVDHTKEFHTLFNKDEKISEADQDILDDIPGDEAYDSDDLMAPLRETPKQRIHDEASQTRLKRSDTISSYFTKNVGRIRSGTLDVSYAPQSILDLQKYEMNDDNVIVATPSIRRDPDSNREPKPIVNDDELDAEDFGYYQGSDGTGLRITNPDSD